jgi:NAD-dependent DNA ligase
VLLRFGAILLERLLNDGTRVENATSHSQHQSHHHRARTQPVNIRHWISRSSMTIRPLLVKQPTTLYQHQHQHQHQHLLLLQLLLLLLLMMVRLLLKHRQRHWIRSMIHCMFDLLCTSSLVQWLDIDHCSLTDGKNCQLAMKHQTLAIVGTLQCSRLRQTMRFRSVISKSICSIRVHHHRTRPLNRYDKLQYVLVRDSALCTNHWRYGVCLIATYEIHQFCS